MREPITVKVVCFPSNQPLYHNCLMKALRMDGPVKYVGELAQYLNPLGWGKRGAWQVQHLYFISDEEIKEGYYRGGIKVLCAGAAATPGSPRYEQMGVISVSQVSKDKLWGQDGVPHKLSDCKKIVATTNPDLWHTRHDNGNTEGGVRIEYKEGLAKITNDFIKGYVDAQGGISEVEIIIKDGEVRMATWKIASHRGQGIIEKEPEKKLYTRRELKEKAWAGFVAAFGLMNEEAAWDFPKFSKWFDKNYPE